MRRGTVVLALFILVVAACAAPKPRPDEHEPLGNDDGPVAGIADFRTGQEGPGDDPETDSYEVDLVIHLDHSIGFVSVPVIEIGARSGEAEVTRSRVTEREGLVLEHSIALPTTGKWSIDLYADGRYVRSLEGALSKSLCAGGQRAWDDAEWSATAFEDGESSPVLTRGGLTAGRTPPDEHFSYTFRGGYSVLADEPRVAVAEWALGGKVVLRQSHESEHLATSFKALDELDEQATRPCVSDAASLELSVPKGQVKSMTSGKWQLRIHLSSGQSREFSFVLVGNEGEQSSAQEEGYIDITTKERDIPTPPAIQKELADRIAAIERSPAYSRAPELRAVVRDAKTMAARVALNRAVATKDSEAIAARKKELAALVAQHGGPFKAAEKTSGPMRGPERLTADTTPVPENGCDRTRCSSYPALSPDHKFVVYRTRSCLFAKDGGSASAPITRHFQLAADGSEEVPSRDVSSYRPLDCASTGFKIVEKDDTVVVGESGNKLDVAGASPVVAICAHPVKGTVVVVHHQEMLEGLTGEPVCVEGSSFEVVSVDAPL